MTNWLEGLSHHERLAGANRGRLTLETTFYHYSLMLSLSLKCLLLLSLYVLCYSVSLNQLLYILLQKVQNMAFMTGKVSLFH